MTLSLDLAQVYDVESFPNVFTLTAEALYSDERRIYEISEYRDDRQYLLQWFNYLQQHQIPMIGFNNESYDYAMVHFIYTNPHCTVADIYTKNQAYFASQQKGDKFAHTIWPRDRFAPQIDLFKLHHMDNKSKTTSLKALQVNMRASTVLESPVPFGQPVAQFDVDQHVIPYNIHDVTETKRFAHISMESIQFRVGLIEQFGVECLCWNDGKIGEKMLEQRLGDDVCYDRSSGRKVKRQTVRSRIALKDIIFPYIQFENPEFQRVHQYMLEQTLTPDDLDDPDATVKTKGAIKISATVGGIEFAFGTGGVHGSVERQRFHGTDEWPLRDIDVKALYPSVAVVNRLAPAHLGEAFVAEYAKIPAERDKYAKGTQENATLKLASNVPWGKSNNKYSVFFDSQYAMTIPINGQLMICMLAEWLLAAVPSMTLIQANTDGLTYRLHRDHMETAKTVEGKWQEYTQLRLEDASYRNMWIRDVNNYIAEHMDGKLKQIGAYWHPKPGAGYAESISKASPPAWHKDFNPVIVPRAAVAAMVHGIDPETFIRAHTDPFDFMLRAKVDRSSTLYLGDDPIQSTTRYYVAREGLPLVKVSPPPAGAVLGAYKRKNGVTQAQYEAVMRTNGGEWHPDVCTGNRSKYEERRTAIQAGWRVAECNDASMFRFDNVDYAFYIAETKKLIIT